MFKCYNCGVNTKAGYHNYMGKFVCSECAPIIDSLHFDVFEITESGVEQKEPFLGKDESEQRYSVIMFAYNLFNQKLNPAAYSLLKKYIKKGYTYLGILRAIEYFYIVKRNNISKSKNSIGIVPYVYQDAQNFYNYKNQEAYRKYLKAFAVSKLNKPQEKIVPIVETTKTHSIDMNEI